MSDPLDPAVDPSGGQVAEEKASGLSKEAAKDIGVIAKGGAVQVVGQIIQRSSSFVFTAIATRMLGPAGYGLYRLVSQSAANLAQLGMLGFNYGTMRFMAKGRASKDPAAVKGALTTGLVGTLLSSLVVLVGTLVLAEPIARFFADDQENLDDLTRLLRLASPYVFLFAVLQTIRYATQAYKTMVPSVTAGNIVQPGVRFVLGVALLLVGLEEAGMVIALNVSVAVAIGVALWWLRRLMTDEQKAAPARVGFGPMLRFSVPQAGASLLGVQSLGLGLLVLGYYSSDFAVGLFAIAIALQGPGNVFLGGIVNIWAPVVSDLYDRGEIDRLGSLYQTINRWIATFSFPVFAALLIDPDVFVTLFAGSEGQSAGPVVAILALGNIFYTGTGPTGYVISMTGHPTVNFVNSVVAVSMYVGLGVIFVPEHGVIGMAWIDTFVTAVINTVRVIEARILVGIHPFGRTFYKPVVATLAGAAVLLLWKLIPGDSTLLGIGGIAVGLVVYVFALRLLGIDEEERHVLQRIKKRAIRRKG